MAGAANGDELPERLIGRARGGDQAAMGRLLEQYRNYLWLLARSQIGTALAVRVEPSDAVQEAFLEAQRDFETFAGNTEGELLVWLRQILVRNLVDQGRHHRAHRRDAHREQSLERMLERSGTAAHEALRAAIPTPSASAARREEAVLLADALHRLPADYREVIILRHLERLKFDQIAARMNRSAGAVRMLWTRAIEKLSQEWELDR